MAITSRTRLSTGFTLIDSLFAIALLLIVSAVIVPSYHHFSERLAVRRVSDSLMNALESARTFSVLSGESMRVCPSDSGNSCDANWSSGVRIATRRSNNTRRYFSFKDAAVHIVWKSVTGSAYIDFEPNNEHSLINGRFTVTAGKTEQVILLNRLGHSHLVNKTVDTRE